MFDFQTEDYDSLDNSQLKKLADYWMRQYLLATTENSGGYYLCPLKNKRYRAEEMHVSHFVDRGALATRYSLDNCHLISKQSNSYDAQIPKEGYKSLHHYEYELFLGEKKVKELIELSKEFRIFAKEDYIEKIKFFRNV